MQGWNQRSAPCGPLPRRSRSVRGPSLRGAAEDVSLGGKLDVHGEAASAMLREWRRAVGDGGLPTHLAIVPDGNRRWAKARGMPASLGHQQGRERMTEVVRWVMEDLKVPHLTVFALSSDNVASRSREELRVLFGIIAGELEALADNPLVAENRIRVRVAGQIPQDQTRLLAAARGVEARTAAWGQGGILTLCVAYSGRAELAAAARGAAEAVARGELAAGDVTEDTLAGFLTTAGTPDPDLVRPRARERARTRRAAGRRAVAGRGRPGCSHVWGGAAVGLLGLAGASLPPSARACSFVVSFSHAHRAHRAAL